MNMKNHGLEFRSDFKSAGIRAWDTYYDTIHDTQVFIRETVGMTEEEKKKALFKATLEGKLIDFDLVGAREAKVYRRRILAQNGW